MDAPEARRVSVSLAGPDAEALLRALLSLLVLEVGAAPERSAMLAAATQLSRELRP
ncbi:MAG: hypothetical protein ACRD0B_04500 [Acidimicrobiales bacterium]